MEFCAELTDADTDPVAWACAREAEGWHAIGVADHLWMTRPFPHLWATLGAIAVSTSRITITSSFANNLFRSPVEFAQASLSLQALSHGRFEAGLGAGWLREEMDATGREFPPAPTRARMYREAVLIVRELFREGRCRFEGRHYRVDVPMIGPAVPAPPLCVSVGGPWTIRHVAPLADRVELKAAGAGTRDGHLDLAALGKVTVAGVRAMVEQAREAGAAGPLGLFALCAAGTGPGVRAFGAALGDGLYAGFAGDPGRVAENLLRVAEAGIDRVQVTAMAPGTIEALAPHLLPPG